MSDSGTVPPSGHVDDRPGETDWRTVLASIPGVVYRLRVHIPTRRIFHDFVSDGIRELAGMEPAEALGDATAFVNLIHPDHLPEMEAALVRALETGEPGDVEYRLRRRDGTVKWVRGKFKLSGAFADGWVVFDGFAVDITAQKQAEQAVRENDAKFRALFEGTSAGVILVDIEADCVLDCNAAVLDLLGCERADVVGKPADAFRAPIQPGGLTAAELMTQAKECAFRTGGHRQELVLKRPDGTEIPIEVAITVFSLGGRPVGLGIVADIRERKRTEDALRRAADVAEAANRAKSKFLAHMSHELRTPMNGILGLTELALDNDPTPDQRQYLELVKGSAESLLALLNDLLDLSKIESGKLELEHTGFGLRKQLDEAVRPFLMQAEAKGLVFTIDLEAGVPDALVGDPHRLKQILVNLVGNAVKFTEQGEVAIRAAAELPAAAASSSPVVLRFTVRDTGIGIPRGKQRSIFQSFEQADRSTTRRYGGTGLGLTIAARLVDMLGGQIDVESTPGHGSTFSFTARFASGSAFSERDQPGVTNEQVSGRCLRVMLAEDHEVNQVLVCRLLERKGHQVVVVEDGRKALETLEGGGFDLALLDVQMPELDGLTVAAEWRKRERERGRPRLPVLALTAYSMRGDRERCLAAGMDGYLSKPLRAVDLYAALDRWTPSTASVTPTHGRVIDPATIRASCGGDQQLLDEIIHVFQSRAPILAANVQAAVVQCDSVALARAAHACKGVVATFSGRAASLARRLEDRGQSGMLEGVDEMSRELSGLLDKVREELTGLRADGL